MWWRRCQQQLLWQKENAIPTLAFEPTPFLHARNSIHENMTPLSATANDEDEVLSAEEVALQKQLEATRARRLALKQRVAARQRQQEPRKRNTTPSRGGTPAAKRAMAADLELGRQTNYNTQQNSFYTVNVVLESDAQPSFDQLMAMDSKADATTIRRVAVRLHWTKASCLEYNQEDPPAQLHPPTNPHRVCSAWRCIDTTWF